MSVNSDIQVVSSAEAQDVDYGSADVIWVLEFAMEPSYVSEIARKLMEADFPYNYNFGGVNNDVLLDENGDPMGSIDDVENKWSQLTENKAIRTVSSIVNIILEADEVVAVSPDYETEQDAPRGQGQAKGSPHLSYSGTGNVEEDMWRSYKIVRHTPEDDRDIGDRVDEFGIGNLGDKARDLIDGDVTISDKIRITRRLSGWGNDVSRDAEAILQDSLNRQFKYYEQVELSGYNSPGIDFYVKDEGKRRWGLAVEISVRWVNPVDKPYVESKKDKAFGLDADLVILAPRFTKRMAEKYEPAGEGGYHSDPLGDHVHLHGMPSSGEKVYRPFAKSSEDLADVGEDKSGNPVIVPDSDKMRNRISNLGLVGDSYPVVNDDYGSFRRLLRGSYRNFDVVTESEYRNAIREAVEPLLWEFLRPYKIEQFLLDTYWDKQLTQSQIGSLVDRSGSTIGRWMREWGVMRRGTGAPELSDETLEIWKRMYEGQDPFPEEFSGYRIQAEYNRHPLWDLDDWRQWYEDTTEDDRKDVMASQGSFRENLDYTVMVGASDRLLPSYTFILRTLRDEGVEIREPDEAPRVPYQAYPSSDALEYMINKNQDTIVDVS